LQQILVSQIVALLNTLREALAVYSVISPLRTAGVADTLGGQWIIPAAITRCEPMTVMECNP